MPHSLVSRLIVAERDLQVRRSELMVLQLSESEAANALGYYAQEVELETWKMTYIESVIGEMWLDLMNSGMSHRQFLNLVRSLES